MTNTNSTILKLSFRRSLWADLLALSFSFGFSLYLLNTNIRIWTTTWDLYSPLNRIIMLFGNAAASYLAFVFARHFIRAQGAFFTPLSLTLENDFIHIDRYCGVFGTTTIARSSISKLKAIEIAGGRKLDLSINGRRVGFPAVGFDNFDRDLLALYRWIQNDPLAIPDSWGSSLRRTRFQALNMSVAFLFGFIIGIGALFFNVPVPWYYFPLFFVLFLMSVQFLALGFLLPKNPTHWLVAHRGTRVDVEAERKRVAALRKTEQR